MDGIEIPFDNLIQAIIVLSIGVLIIVTNVIIIATFITAPGPREVLAYYLLSLSVADLLSGLLVVPLSVYPALVGAWMYGEILCSASSYLSAVLWSASAYTIMWMGVDRYIAVRKPMKYETVQTPARVQCWVAVSWIAPAMFCAPMGVRGAAYDKQAAVCLLEWSAMPAYSATLALLILGPTSLTIIYVYICIFNDPQPQEFSEHLNSFTLAVLFWLSWLPFILITFLEYLMHWTIQVNFLHFTGFWIPVSFSAAKIVVYLALNKNFRYQLKMCCKAKRTDYRDDF